MMPSIALAKTSTLKLAIGPQVDKFEIHRCHTPYLVLHWKDLSGAMVFPKLHRCSVPCGLYDQHWLHVIGLILLNLWAPQPLSNCVIGRHLSIQVHSPDTIANNTEAGTSKIAWMAAPSWGVIGFWKLLMKSDELLEVSDALGFSSCKAVACWLSACK